MRKGTLSVVMAVAFLGSLPDSAHAQRRGQPVQLPEGAGQELVQANCTQCHGLNMIPGSGFDEDGWEALVATMVALPEMQSKTVASYLAEHFPERPERRPTLVPGDTSIEITEWIVPTLGQRSRDPVEAPDGSIWWTGMWASLAGRLDPKTGTMEEFRLPPEARPHTVLPDADGNIWYTGNSNATVGKLDPRTAEITEYPTQARDPHSAVFHPDGRLYFTAQGAGMLGRLHPETGELTEIETEPRPYGMQVAANGTVWVAYNGTNKLGALDPETMEVRYYEVPDETSRVRRLGLTSEAWFGTETPRMAASDDWTPRRAKSRSGRHPVDPTRIPMRWPSWTMSSGTTRRGCGLTLWCGSILKRNSSKVGPFLPVLASSATCG